MGRQMSLENKRDPRAAVQTAEMLEVWLRFALFTLVGELAALQADGEDHWRHSDEVQYLRQITAVLAALALLTAKIKREASGRLHGIWRRVDWDWLSGIPMGKHSRPKPSYLDSS